ncbi:MAG: hypothetical protein OEO83_19095 [Alphaproteobacteria bacterium]|nr:hypothetical protein [Alphaproteobacteria bacterium]
MITQTARFRLNKFNLEILFLAGSHPSRTAPAMIGGIGYRKSASTGTPLENHMQPHSTATPEEK